ncbi:GntR family transcriptional regulator [Nocardiopsis gilva YIM 90087]|uniref:GntR family transcriptional regulator n=1 Tax=Nocardiopsis gilva YIM 90087 TaxID=1235441 RepID=A0A223S3F8_9ACTN|nr:GntR family transcriptional regulator [Nocardiopsis gilva]ASU82655.1 GntR family transcriptional regulator [Nocardiopsis gilva YIM 90087]
MDKSTTTDGGRPRYLRIAQDLKLQIHTGALPAGARVPSESELIRRYGVAQGTVRKAVTELRAIGLVETHHGKGTFVRSRPPVRRKSSDRFRRSHRAAGMAAYLAESDQAGVEAEVRVSFVGSLDAPEDIARRLCLPPGKKVLARRRLYLSDGTPTEEATSYIPWDIAKETPELFAENPGPGGIYARLEERGHHLAEYVEEISVRIATKEETSALSMGTGSPVIQLIREAVDKSGRTVEVCDTIMSAGQFVLEYRISADE